MLQWIYVGWIMALVITGSATAIGFVFGYWGKGTIVMWRRIKLASTFAGLFAVLFLLLNFESIVLNIHQSTDRYESRLRSAALQMRANACKVQPEWCHVHDQVFRHFMENLPRMDSLSRLDWPVQVWVLVDELAGVLEETKEEMYREQALRREERVGLWSLSPYARLGLFFCAAICVGLAVGGSIGEAAFQLRLAEEEQKRAASVS